MLIQAGECALATVAYRELERRAATDPAMAMACAGLLKKPLQRDAIERMAFRQLARKDPKRAAAFVDAVIDRPWVGEIGLDAAVLIGDSRLILAAARAEPHVTLRDVQLLVLYPWGKQAIRAAVEKIPGEALAVASGNSPTAQVLREQLLGGALAGLLAREDIDLPTRQRLAWVNQTLTAQEVRDDRVYLTRLAELGYAGELRRAAEDFVHDRTQPPKWTPAELYRLAVYGRARIDKALYVKLFAQIGAPSPDWPRIREYVADAAVHGLAAKLPPALLEQTMRDITGLEQMILAGEIIDGTPESVLPLLAKGLAEGSVYQGLLAAHLRLRNAKAGDWAKPYQGYLRAPASFQVPKRSIQRYFFYDDEDGWLSFRGFQAAYRGDKRWRWTEKDGVVKLTAQSKSRRIEIYANKPGVEHVALPAPADVLVHRGHEYHLYRTLRQLDENVKLVYLGACRGVGYVETVLHNAQQAQMFATRGTGTVKVNDPLLKALNERLLSAGDQVNWAEFWQAQQRRFTSVADFRDYVPPHRNTTAILLRGYYAYLAE